MGVQVQLDLRVLKRKSMKMKRKAKTFEAELSKEAADNMLEAVAPARLTIEQQPRG